VPELPEVEVVRLGLAPAVTGAMIQSVEVREERSLRRHLGPSEDFVERLEGRSIQSAVRRGKFLWLPLSPLLSPPASPLRSPPVSPPLSPLKKQEIRADTATAARNRGMSGESPAFSEKTSVGADSAEAEALVVHLGMSGQVLLRDLQQPDDSLLRIRLTLDHPTHGALSLAFVDQRIFGSMAIDYLVPTEDGQAAGLGSDAALVPSQVAHIARDPLDPAFDDALFLRKLRRRNTGIKRALLDQTLVSGIGNIYADEALWAARIHYDQPTSSLSTAKAKTLLAEARLVLANALAEGGTSFDATYVDVNGASGYFSHSLNAYGQQGKDCPRCGRPIVREKFMNRGSHFCGFCQRVRAA
jgi:formamidopyrimidine-DNA glycosylase